MARANGHGIFGLLLVIGMFVCAFLKKWKIPWGYFVISILLYSVTIIVFTIVLELDKVEEMGRFNIGRFRWGAHLSIIFLAIGILIDFDSNRTYFGYFFGSIAAGLAIPFLVVRKETK